MTRRELSYLPTRIAARSGLLMAVAVGMIGCASSPKPDVDPIFTAVPGGKYDCYYAADDRNVVVKGATSTVGQAAVAGAAGGLLGNQIGSGRGRDIATGVGAAAGLAAGAWNARRMQDNRVDDCLQRQSPTGSQSLDGYNYQYQGG